MLVALTLEWTSGRLGTCYNVVTGLCPQSFWSRVGLKLYF